jgi:hypothetical protein
MKKMFAVLLGLFLSLNVFAAAKKTSQYSFRKGMYPAVFQFGGGMMLNSQNRVRGAGGFSWTPTYHFSETLAARFFVGLFYRNLFVKDELRVGDIGFTLIEKPKFNSPLYGELGGGVQYWTGDSSRKFYPQLKAGFGYQFGDADSFFKSFQLSYAYVLNAPLKNHQLVGNFTIGF